MRSVRWMFATLAALLVLVIPAQVSSQIVLYYDATAVHKPTSCSAGQVLTWSGTAFVCSAGTDAGATKAIKVAFTAASMGGTVSSTATIPELSTVFRVIVLVSTPFTGGLSPTATVTVYNLGGSTTLQTTTDSDLTISGEYQTNETIEIPAGRGGPVQITLGGTALFGGGTVYVLYGLAAP